MTKFPKTYHRFNALTLEIQKVEARLYEYVTSDDSNTPSAQMMVTQYSRKRRELYADYCQELFSLPVHPAEMLPFVVQLSERVFIDTESTSTAELTQSLSLLLKTA